VSLNTVKFHLKNIYEKLGGVENRWSAIANWQSQYNELLLPSVRAHCHSEATS
jgi:ATP/maltotriose-dependent transcriptional regulator MalT